MLYRFLALILVVTLMYTPLKAEYDAQEIMDMVIHASDASEEEEALWKHYISQPQPSVEEVRDMIAAAADEFSVPASILETIGYLENNWIQMGPSRDGGWGIMHLVDNGSVDTLGKAAELLSCDRQTLKDDAETNIRGAAALLAHYAAENRSDFTRLEDWLPAVKKLSGLYGEEFQEMQAAEYYRIMRDGVSEVNLFNQTVSIKANSKIDVEYINSKLTKYNAWKEKSRNIRSDYPGALTSISSCNYTGGRNHRIDTWVNHWMGMGTYAGCISWFHNPNANASTHFAIRHTDGEITQIVWVGNTSWNCGSSSGPYNNSRSISVEHEATAAHPEWWYSGAMIQASGRMIRYFSDKHGIPRVQGCPGITEHKAMQGCSTSCAGNIPWGDLWNVINDGNPPSSDPGGQTGTISVNTSANVRSGPAISFSVIGSLYNGDKVQILGKEGEWKSWYKTIIPDGRVGYVHESLVIF